VRWAATFHWENAARETLALIEEIAGGARPAKETAS
jgi:hypothetical protein